MMYSLTQRSLYIYIIFVALISQNAFAQEKDFIIPDSLKGKDYEYLDKQFRTYYSDTITSLVYLNTIYKKGLIENNIANQSFALSLLAYYTTNRNDKLDLIKKSIAKGEEEALYMSLSARLMLGINYHSHFEYEKALQEYLILFNNSKKANSEIYEFNALNRIAQLKRDIGSYKEALETYKKCLNYEKLKIPIDSASLTRTYVDLAESMRYLKKHDSASYYYRYIKDNGYKKNNFYLNIATINQGINLYEIGKLKESEALLHQGLQNISLNNKSSHRYHTLSLLYLGKINQSLNKDLDKTKRYFQTIDSLYTATNIIIPETREVYEFFIKDYIKQKDANAQINTINKLMKFDSIAAERKINTLTKFHSEYDTLQLTKSKEEIIKNLEKQKTQLNKRIIYLSVFILLFIILFLIQYKKHKTYKDRFNKIISELDTHKEENTPSYTSLTSEEKLLDVIDKATISTIVDKLTEFEEKQGFLQKDITLSILAKKCATNTKYLPKIINAYKNKSFVNYINSLRVDYILKELKENTTLQKYTIKTISEEAGFNTPESFARAFKNKTGIRPSYYIRNLKKKGEN